MAAGDRAEQPLSRFVDAQRDAYPQALREIRAGRKQSHWMWFVFPQLRGLGMSAMSQRYAIDGVDEARRYLAHPVLGPRLLECCNAILASTTPADAMFGYPDDLKLRSCMTLFALADPRQPIFGRVLAARFGGQRDLRTVVSTGQE